jgi:hypothetical protein
MKKIVIYFLVVVVVVVIHQYWFNSVSSLFSETTPRHGQLNPEKLDDQKIQTQQKFTSNNSAQSCLPESEYFQKTNSFQQRYNETVHQLQAALAELAPEMDDIDFTLRNDTVTHLNPKSSLGYAFFKFQLGGSLDDLKATLKKTEVPANGAYNSYALLSAIMQKQQLQPNDVLELLSLGLTVQFEDLVHATLTFQDIATLQILRDQFRGDLATEWRRHGYYYNLSLISAESLNLEALEFWNSMGIQNLIAGATYNALDLVPFPRQQREITLVASIVDYLVRAGVNPQQQITYIRLGNWLTINADDEERMSVQSGELSPELTQKLNDLAQQQTSAYQQLLSHRQTTSHCYPNSYQSHQFEQTDSVVYSSNRYVDEINTLREQLATSAATEADNEIYIAVLEAATQQDVDSIMQLLNEHSDKPWLQLERVAAVSLLKEGIDPDKIHQLLSKSPLPATVLMSPVFTNDLATLKKLGQYSFEVDPNDKNGDTLIAIAKEYNTNTEIIEYLQQLLMNREQ